MEIHWPFLIAGILLCFFGWTFYWLGLRVIGAICGGILGGGISLLVGAMLEVSERFALPVVCLGALVGMILGVLLFKALHYYLFFLAGSSLGGVLGHLILRHHPEWGEAWLQNWAAQALFQFALILIFGFLFVFFQRSILILLTSLVGSMLILVAVSANWIMWLFVPIFLTSLIAQSRILKRLRLRWKIHEHLEDAAETVNKNNSRHSKRKR